MAFSLTSFLAPYGYQAHDVYTLGAAFAAFMTIMLVGSTLIERKGFGSRIKNLQERRKALKDEISAPRHRRQKHQGSVDFMRSMVKRLHLMQKNQVSNIQSYLATAGIRNRDAVYVLLFFRFLCPVIGTIIGLVYASFDLHNYAEKPLHLFIPLIFSYVGYKLPDFVVRQKRKKRYLLIQRALADTLDLLMICAEAGLSLAQGLDRVAKELSRVYPEMADELMLTSIELSFQPDRQKTLQGLAARAQLPEIKGIVNVLVQTEKYGTPISQALRTLSAEFRTQRMLRAEQKAARLPAIMTVPMIVFILPTLFIVVMAPAVISVLRTTQ